MRRNAHTLAELVVVIMIMGVLAMVALPRLQFRAVEQKKLAAAAYKLVADLRRARSMALRDAATNNKGFSLLRKVDDISGLQVGYEIEDLDSHVTVDTVTFDAGITANGNQKYNFGPLGNLVVGSTPITLTAEGKTYTISFVAATGAVICTES